MLYRIEKTQYLWRNFLFNFRFFCYIVILFVNNKQNSLIYIYTYIIYIYIYILYTYCLNLTPSMTKRKHIWKKVIWSFLLYLYNGFFLVLVVLYEKSCFRKGAAHSVTAVVTTLLSPSSVHPIINKINKRIDTVNRREAS